MNLAQMRTLLPILEEKTKGRPSGFGPLYIEEGEPVLNNLTPFAVQTLHVVLVWVLDRHGRIIHEYTERP